MSEHPEDVETIGDVTGQGEIIKKLMSREPKETDEDDYPTNDSDDSGPSKDSSTD